MEASGGVVGASRGSRGCVVRASRKIFEASRESLGSVLVGVSAPS